MVGWQLAGFSVPRQRNVSLRGAFAGDAASARIPIYGLLCRPVRASRHLVRAVDGLDHYSGEDFSNDHYPVFD